MIKQLKVYQKIYIEINYNSIAIYWLLLVTKSSNGTEILNLKIES